MPDIPLGGFSNRLLPGTVGNDRGVDLGGIGSGPGRRHRPGAGGDQSEAKISALIGLSHHRILVQERTDNAARVHSVDLRRATNILGSRWDSPTTSPSLEQRQDPATELVITPTKQLVVDPCQHAGRTEKVEGLSLVAPGLLAVINDNDFGMTDWPGAFDPSGRLVDSGVETRLLFVAISGGGRV